jgi:hypothetical protein
MIMVLGLLLYFSLALSRVIILKTQMYMTSINPILATQILANLKICQHYSGMEQAILNLTSDYFIVLEARLLGLNADGILLMKQFLVSGASQM